MAEFCLDCINECMGKKKLREKDVYLEFDLCEGCGEWKPCVVKRKDGIIRCFLKFLRLNR